MVVHEHHKSDLSEGSDEFAHFARIQKVLPGSDFDNVFFSKLMKLETIQIPPYAGKHRPAREKPFKWRFAVVPMMAQHLMLAW